MIKVLIADDSRTTREIIKNNLKMHFPDIDIYEASNGVDAIEIATVRRPHLIISDVMMPKLNGYMTCKKLKDNILTKNIPIILLTMKKEETDKQWGLNCGADAYLTKPFKPQELIDAVKNYI